MPPRDHLSIGEVLALLQEDFPDLTISKIRFLESEGLLDPERTPSGYRKFYGDDVDRLRWILVQQREHFLPLKVIKTKLEEVERGGDPSGDSTDPPVHEPSVQATTASLDGADPGLAGASMTVEELAGAAGISLDDIAELERFGLLVGRAVGPDVLYDEGALIIARLAAGFRRHGVEPRHLRMYKVTADREAGFLEQVVTPMLKQRNPTARSRALAMVDDLLGLGAQLRAAMLEQALRDNLGRR
jgi:DNA-binding transcriptional MerR regulator